MDYIRNTHAGVGKCKINFIREIWSEEKELLGKPRRSTWDYYIKINLKKYKRTWTALNYVGTESSAERFWTQKLILRNFLALCANLSLSRRALVHEINYR